MPEEEHGTSTTPGPGGPKRRLIELTLRLAIVLGRLIEIVVPALRVGNRAKRGHYLALRAEIEEAVATRETPRLMLTGLVEAWDSGDPLTRRQLLWTLFESLDVKDGAIIAGQPRREVEAEVAAYLEGWIGPYGLPLRLRFAEASDSEATSP